MTVIAHQGLLAVTSALRNAVPSRHGVVDAVAPSQQPENDGLRPRSG
ncbi:hypothetical protein OV450_2554 [Actinobacteria bacterium OV450]|nr:hypothetical protein OV450_2554 [Actinobacteria bacterium OV450]